MPDFGDKSYLGRVKGVCVWNFDLQFKLSPCIRGVRRACYCACQLSQVICHLLKGNLSNKSLWKVILVLFSCK